MHSGMCWEIRRSDNTLKQTKTDSLRDLYVHPRKHTDPHTEKASGPAKSLQVSVVGDQGVEVGCLLVVLAMLDLQGALLL